MALNRELLSIEKCVHSHFTKNIARNNLKTFFVDGGNGSEYACIAEITSQIDDVSKDFL